MCYCCSCEFLWSGIPSTGLIIVSLEDDADSMVKYFQVVSLGIAVWVSVCGCLYVCVREDYPGQVSPH